ncbi:MAG: hypothetical protein Q9203_004555 [Teloschistes exilis]
MARKRPQAFQNGGANGRSKSKSKPDDLESAISSARKPTKFQDVARLAVNNEYHAKLKHKLLDDVKRGSLEGYRKSAEEIKGIKKKKVRQFYEAQNERINDWLEVDTVVTYVADDVLDSMHPQDLDGDGIAERRGALHESGNRVQDFLPEDEQEKRRKAERSAKWAININVIANVILLIAKGIAAGYSSSLSLIASLVDSALDLLCTLIVWTTNKLVSWRIKKLRKKFPVGRQRLEPLGILVFSIIMVISFLQILQESVKKLLPGGPRVAAGLPPTAIGALVATVVIKGIIGIGCVRVKTTQVQALAQDCKTDVYFNTLSLLFPLIGHQFSIWWLDPVGAALLSLYVIYDWAETSFENVIRLSGSAVDDRLLKKIMFLAWRFAPIVQSYKTITAYHAGDGVWVEIDVLLDPKTPLEQAHDIAETLQYCLEAIAAEMPRSMAPPPSGEFSIVLTKSFGATPTEKTEIIGEPNRFATIKVTNHVGAQNQTIIAKEGTIQADDVNELLSIVQPLGGLPSNPDEDVYGFDTRIILSTFEVQWDNGEDVEGVEARTNPTEENKQTFKDVMDSINALARQTAKERTSTSSAPINSPNQLIMRVLLLGATGNLGSRILPALLAHNHTVVAFIRSESKLRNLVHSSAVDKCTIVTGDATDATAIEAALVDSRCNALVNTAGLAAIFPWQDPQMQEIEKAVTTAAVGASRKLGYPMRGWFLGGMTVLDFPRYPGTKVSTYFPIFAEHGLTYSLLLSQPSEHLQWSLLAPSQMVPASKEITLLSAPRGHGLVSANDTMPNYMNTFLSGLPFGIGIASDILVNALRYNTSLEDCADYMAADLAKDRSEHVGHRVGVIASGRKGKKE